MERPLDRKRFAVIGGGISGLSAAHRLVELSPDADVVLFESSDRLGGVLQTERHSDLLIERAADMFITRDPWALDLCRRIGFVDQLIPTSKEARGAYVVHRGQLVRVPQGFVLMRPTQFWPVLTSPLFSLRGKLRLAMEPFIPRRKDNADESLQSFAQRRLGREAYENLVQPLIGGIYTADPHRLSMQATMAQFVEMERQHGSLVRAALRRKVEPTETASAGARYGMFVAPRDGMSTFVDAIASRLPPSCARLKSPVRRLARQSEGRWLIEADGTPAEVFDGVIVAAPAHAAARLLESVDMELSQKLEAIDFAGVTVAVLALPKSQVDFPRDASGYVTPIAERRKVLALSFSSLKFASRAPDDVVVMRAFIGGAIQPELNELPDDAIQQIVRDELRDLLNVSADPPFWRIVRWKNAMPQYHVGHLNRVAAIEESAEQLPGLELAGNSYRGVGIPFCVRSGERAAERLLGVSESITKDARPELEV